MWGKKKSQKTQTNSRARTRLVIRRRKMRLVLFAILICLLIPIYIGFAWLSYHPKLNIQTIQVQGVNELREETIQFFIESQLDDGVVHLFSTKNELFLNRNALVTGLIDKFPRVKSVKIPFTKFSQKLIVYLEERTPEFLWCDNNEDNEKCYVVDENGYIFASYDIESSNDYIILRSKLVSENILRATVTSTKNFENLKLVFKLIKNNLELNVASVDIDDSDGYVYLDSGLFVKVDLNFDINNQISNLETILDSNELKNSKESIEYIDLRFNNRVYYKLHGE